MHNNINNRGHDCTLLLESQKYILWAELNKKALAAHKHRYAVDELQITKPSQTGLQKNEGDKTTNQEAWIFPDSKGPKQQDFSMPDAFEVQTLLNTA